MAPPDNKQELPPGAVSALNAQAGGLYQLSPEDEAIVNEYARQKGVTQADAVRTLLRNRQVMADVRASEPTVMERTLGAINQAQALGVASSDPNDVINSMGRGVVIKSLAAGLDGNNGNNKKPTSYDDLKEMMYLRIMGGLAGINNDNNQGQSAIVQEMRNETDKLRQELRDSEAKRVQEQKDAEAKRQQDQKDAETRRQADIDKIKAEMRDMLFEKKIEKLEEKATAAQASVSQELKNLSDKLELYRSIPQAAPEKKDAFSEIEDIGGKIERIRKATAALFPQAAAPAAPALSVPPSPPPALKNPDGSTDYLAAVERIGGIVVKGIEAFNKKPPAAAEAAQPAQPAAQPAYTERRMGLDEYADYLLSLKERSPEQQQWLINYQAHLEREQAKLRPPVAAEQQSTERQAMQPFRPPAEQPSEIHEPQQPDQLTDEVIEEPAAGAPEQDEPPAEQPAEAAEEQPTETGGDAVERMREAEAQRARLLRDVVV